MNYGKKEDFEEQLEIMRTEKRVKPYSERLKEVNRLLEDYENIFDDSEDNNERLSKGERERALSLMSDYLLSHILRDRTTSKTKGYEYPFHSRDQERRRKRREFSVMEVFPVTTKNKRRRKVDEI